MTIEEQLKSLILSQYGTLTNFVPLTGLSYGTVDTILRKGVGGASVHNVIAICKALGISADELGHGRITPINGTPEYNYVLKEMTSILKLYRMNIERYKDITIDSIPITREDAETIVDTMEFAVELIRRKRKREKEQ